jgi:hypothetical protein
MTDWIPTGISDFSAFEFNTQQKQWLTLELRKFDIELANQNDFFADFEHALNMYRGGKNLREETKPSIIRANLKMLKLAADDLNNKINKIDGNSRALITKELPYPYLDMRQHIHDLYLALCRAENTADEYPKKGALPDNSRLQLAIDTVKTIYKHTKIAPTSSREGLYESVLTIILTMATGEEYSGLHALLYRAINSYKRDPSN